MVYRTDSQTHRGGVQLGRMVGLAGAVALCVSFFLNQLNIKGPVIPFECVQSIEGVWFLVTFGLPFLAAILLLPLLAFRAVPRVDGVPGVGRFLAVAVCVICLSALSAGLAWMTYAFLPGGFGLEWDMPLLYALPAAGIVSLAIAVAAMVRSRLPRKAAATQFALGADCLAYLAFFTTVGMDVYAGLWVSIAGSGLLATGAAIEWFHTRHPRNADLGNEQNHHVDNRG